MAELPYSFHLGSNKNRKASARSNARNNVSGSSSLANNGIQNYQQLSKVNNHDFRKYENDNDYIYQLKGTNDIVYDVKEFYKTEFEEVRIEYNNKKSRPSRRIDDYFEYVNKDEKRDLACEIIIELGNKEYWDSKDFEFKREMVSVYEEHLHDLERLVPEFKITNAVVHLDETSPHMYIVGVPVKDGCKTGLSKQVNKSSVFTKERLEHIQNVMREKCIDTFNKYFEKENATLKTKEKGRNKDIHVKDMVNYQELKKELEINKRSIDKNNDKIKSINTSSKELKDLLSCLEESRLGGYKLNNKQSRPSRRIDDYFEYVNKDEKRDLACEIIIELGNKEYWDTKDFEFKREMVNVYEEHLHDLERLVPEFKITNAVVHLDETSPHMHIVGVPVKDDCKTGLLKQVNKSSVFTIERLENIKNVMR